MSLSPTTGMSRLSLECNSAVTPDRSQMQSQRTSPAMRGPESDEPSSDVSDWDVEEDDDEEQTNTVSSPAGLKYNISRLSPGTRRMVQGLFNQTSSHDPPQISLELCGLREGDSDGSDVFYAFQMHEVVPCSVRIGSRDSGRFSAPKCECPDARYRHVRPCKHLIWLFDKISKQALFDHDPDTELTMTELGYAEELGDPFDQISQIRLDVLADDLRCDTSEPDSDIVSPNSARVKEAREMVAAVAGIQPYELDDYRPDLEASYDRDVLIRRGDLGATLFSLLLASHSLAEWIRSELSPSDPAVDPFRSAQHRVFRVIQELNEHTAVQQDPTRADAYQRRGKAAEGPRDVNWAATQIQHCVKRIEGLVSRGSSPLSRGARSSAARSLVVILKAVADHRELYARLIGDQDTDFVYSTLDMLADQSQFIDALEEIMDRIGIYGAPPTYVDNMRRLVARMRSHRTEDVSVATGIGAPRSETPPLGEPSSRPAQNPRPSRSPSVQFLTPELPASAMGRGIQGRGGRGRGRGRGNGRGSKRPLPQGSPQDSPGGSSKRSRGS